jgi:hypothetical protein
MRKTLIFPALLALTVAIVFLIQQVRTPRGLVQNVSDKNHVYILLGGMRSWDGVVTSAGMYGLRSELLTSFPYINAKTYTWSSYSDAANEIGGLPKDDVAIVIGYSGGGSRATWLADMAFHPKIDLMVLYDPSPKWQMKSIPVNVKHTVCYHNLRGTVLGLGGGVCKGAGIEAVDINESHLAVQFDERLHQRTIEEVRRVSRAPLRSAPEDSDPLWPIARP